MVEMFLQSQDFRIFGSNHLNFVEFSDIFVNFVKSALQP